MKFVKLDPVAGEELWVNPEHISAIGSEEDGVSMVYVQGDGNPFLVKNSIGDILTLFGCTEMRCEGPSDERKLSRLPHKETE